MKVFLSEAAFMGLILSSIEVYKRECLGILLGYKLEDRFIVEYSIAYQSAKRMRNGVSSNHLRHTRIEKVLSRFDRLELLGDFLDFQLRMTTRFGRFRNQVLLGHILQINLLYR